MNSCFDYQWKIGAFLKGESANLEAQQIRLHLEKCRSCSEKFIREAHSTTQSRDLPHTFSMNFNARIVAAVPEPTPTSTLFKLFCIILAASTGLALTSIAFFNHYLRPRALTNSPWQEELNRSSEMFVPWVRDIIAQPVFHYTAMSLVAVVVSLVLIFIVDRPPKLARARN